MEYRLPQLEDQEILTAYLQVCQEQGLKEVMLGCYKDNLASARTIQKCGGRLMVESDRYEPGRISQYYKIIF